MPNPIQLPNDILLPDSVSWWPIAPIWWLLIALLIALIFIAYRYFRKRADKPLSLKPSTKERDYFIDKIRQIESKHQLHINDLLSVQNLSVIMRQAALHYHPKSPVAQLNEQQWLNFLDKHHAHPYFIQQGKFLAYAPYQKHFQFDDTQLFSECIQWVEQQIKASDHANA